MSLLSKRLAQLFPYAPSILLGFACTLSIVGCGSGTIPEGMQKWECLSNESVSHGKVIGMSPDGKVITFLLPGNKYIERKVEELPESDLAQVKRLMPDWFSAGADQERSRQAKTAPYLEAIPYGMTIEDSSLFRILDNATGDVASSFLMDEIIKYPERGAGIIEFNKWAPESEHKQTVCSIASSISGARYLSLDPSGRLVVWDLRDAKKLNTIESGVTQASSQVAVTPDGVEGFIYGDFNEIIRFDLITGTRLDPWPVAWEQTKSLARTNTGEFWFALDGAGIVHVLDANGKELNKVDLTSISKIDYFALAPQGTEKTIRNEPKPPPTFAAGCREEGKILLAREDGKGGYKSTLIQGLTDLVTVELGETRLVVAAAGRVTWGDYPDFSQPVHEGFNGQDVLSRSQPVVALKLSDYDRRLAILGANGVGDLHDAESPSDYASGTVIDSLGENARDLSESGEVYAIAQEGGAIVFARPNLRFVDPKFLFWRMVNHKLNGGDAKYLAAMLDYFAKPSAAHAKVVPSWEPDTDMLSSAITLIASVSPPNTDPKSHRSRLDKIFGGGSDSKWLKITEALYKARLANLAKSGQAAKIVGGVDAAKLADEALAIIQPMADEASPKPIVLEAMLEAATAKDWALKELRPYMEKLTKCEPGYIAASVRLAQLLQPPYRSEAMDVAKFAISLSEKVPAENKDLLYMAVILGASSQDASTPLTASQWKERAGIDQARMTAGIAAAKTHPISSEYYQAAMKYAWGVEDRELAQAAAEMCKPIELRWSHKQWSSSSEFAQFQEWLKP